MRICENIQKKFEPFETGLIENDGLALAENQ